MLIEPKGADPHLPPTISALVLDDDEFDRRRLVRMGSACGLPLSLSTVSTIEALRKSLDDTRYDVVFLDYRLEGGTGLDALEHLRSHPMQVDTAAIMVSGDESIEVAISAIKGGCDDYVRKQALTPQVLCDTLVSILQQRRLVERKPLLSAGEIEQLVAARLPDALATALDAPSVRIALRAIMHEVFQATTHEEMTALYGESVPGIEYETDDLLIGMTFDDQIPFPNA